ncbi:MAG: hemolysin family protein [Holosporaceae bacterium]|jgi:CBS domain containing-hemolysin-like protein|nr:hemolysin family protein [Holosporaceae bacterium]
MASKIRTYILRLFKKEEGVPLIDRLEDLIESDPQASDEINADDTSEIALVSNVLGLKDLTAEDIMVPRANIVAAEIGTTLDEFVKIFSQNSFSQIPIYKGTLDNVVGVVRVRDFLPYINDPKAFNIESLLKEPIYVVPSIQLLELLVEIRASVNHMALVVDEFGGIDGLVTLHDVVSEIVGEIQQNQSIFPQIIAKQDGSLVADAKTPIFKCEDLLGIELLRPLVEEEDEEPDIETIGGLTMLLAGRMPTRGETFVHPSGIEFDIIEADPRRVKRVLIRKPSD